METENCKEGGYPYSSVTSTKVDSARITWIGYNRKQSNAFEEKTKCTRATKDISRLINFN